MAIRTVNLIWEKRFRHTYPVAPYALRDDGTLALAVPRPLEARAYDRTLLTTGGEANVEGGFTVETLLKLDMSTQAENCIGMTSDDLYLFYKGTKQRFLGDRRLLYVDAALCENGHQLLAAFSDIAGASFALAFGDITGHIGWTTEIEGHATCVAIARQGNRVAVGTETGRILLYDVSRREVWEFNAGSSVRTLACSKDGVFVAYGTREGAVGLVDGDGMRKWEATFQGEVTDLALDGEGKLCAVLFRHRLKDLEPVPNSVRLACIGETGQIEWQYDSEQNLQGVSLSANGKFLATGARNGTIAVYGVVIGEGNPLSGAQATGGARRQANALVKAGDLRGAARLLEIALDSDPTDIVLYQDLLNMRGSYFEGTLGQAQSMRERGDSQGAIRLLDGLLREVPLATEVFTQAANALNAARTQRASQLRQQASEYVQAEEDERAEATLREALTLLPFDSLDIRQELAALRTRRAQAADALAEQSAKEGDLEAGVAFLERAQSITPSPDRARQLLDMQIALEFSAGMNAYNAKEYRDAIFQFKKVLARDPSHAEAKRYLGFAQRFSQDASTDSLNDRFSRLE